MEQSLPAKIKEVLSLHKHKQVSNQAVYGIISNVLSVLLGFKSSYLLDQVCYSPESFKALLDLILSDFNINSDTCVYAILLFNNGELFFSELTACIQHIKNAVENLRKSVLLEVSTDQQFMPTILNVTGTLSEPETVHVSSPVIQNKILSTCEDVLLVLSNIYKKLQLSNNKDIHPEKNFCLHVEEIYFSTNINLCTVYGLLLSYPVVYWFDEELSSKTCLDMIPLIVEKILIPCDLTVYKNSYKPINIKKYEVISFSYPNFLSHTLKYILEAWKSSVKLKLSIFGDNYQLQKTIVTLPCVSL